jgi:outer membrane lipoprotein carrier protein
MNRLFLLACALLASFAPSLAAQDIQSIVRAVEARYQHASTLEAVFLERFNDGHQGIRVESGRVFFSRPGRMRWEYESPETKLFLVDGKNVWFYVPADRTVSRAGVKQSSDWRTPFALLTGKVHLNRLCGRIELAPPASAPAGEAASDLPAGQGNVVLRCLPGERHSSSDPVSFQEILFEVDPQNRLARIVVREPGNIETEFRFGNWQENIPIPESKFHFEPPPGVTIVNQGDLAGAVH